MIGPMGACLFAIGWLMDTFLNTSPGGFACACVGGLMVVAWFLRLAWRLEL